MCKTGQKLSALLRISSHIDSDIKTYHLVWMFCFRKTNNLLNKVHWTALKLTYQVYNSVEMLLETQKVCSIPQRNFQILIIEIYKIVNSVARLIMNSLYEYR